MPLGTLRWPIVFAVALLALCGSADTLSASPIAAEASTFVGEFRAFVADFPRWDAAHLDMPLMLLALTPQQDRPEMLFLLWYLWMHDHPSTAANIFSIPNLIKLVEVSQPVVSGIPGGNNGGGTIASHSGPSGSGGGTGGSGQSTPEPSSLILAACGSLGVIAYRLVRSRAGRTR